MPKPSRLSHHPFLKYDSWMLWEWWVFATVIGIFIGIAVVAGISAIAGQAGATNNMTMFLHIAGVLAGASLGFSQWLVLRRYIKHIRWWIVATAIGAIVAWLIGLKVVVVLILIFLDGGTVEVLSPRLLAAILLLGAWIGAVLGLAQWFVLRPHVRKALLWVFANALAWSVGFLLMFAGAKITGPGTFTLKAALVGIATGVTTGVVIGAITGIGLVWLLKPRLLKHH